MYMFIHGESRAPILGGAPSCACAWPSVTACTLLAGSRVEMRAAPGLQLLGASRLVGCPTNRAAVLGTFCVFERV
jgi:hypothetical protein